MTRPSIILRIASAIILLVAAFFLYRKFVSWFLIDRTGIVYLSDSLTTIWRHALVFSGCFGFVPVGSILLNLRKAKNIVIGSLILLSFLITGIFIKRIVLGSEINEILSLEKAGGEQNEYSFSIDGVLPDVYMVTSLIAGFSLLLVLRKARILFRNDSDESNNNLVSRLLSK